MKLLSCVLLVLLQGGFSDSEPLTENSFRKKLKNLFEGHDGRVVIGDDINEDTSKNLWERYQSRQSPNGIVVGGQGLFDERDLVLEWAPDDKLFLLKLHNTFRSNTSRGLVMDDGTNGSYPTSGDMNSLFWDEAIAAVAQAHSNKCVFGHNNARNTQIYNFSEYATFEYPTANFYMGENIAAQWTGGLPEAQDSLKLLVSSWINEHVDWHYQAFRSGTINGAGHYTQLVWANTRYIGCGLSVCHDPEAQVNMYYLVCDYFPGGNYIGMYPYLSGKNYRHCAPDRTKKMNGLCSGCMSSSYVVNKSAITPNDCDAGPFSIIIETTQSTIDDLTTQDTDTVELSTRVAVDDLDIEETEDPNGCCFTNIVWKLYFAIWLIIVLLQL